MMGVSKITPDHSRVSFRMSRRHYSWSVPEVRVTGGGSIPVLDANADPVSAVCVGVVLFVAGKGAQCGGDEVW